MSKADAPDKTQSFNARVAHQAFQQGLDSISADLKDAPLERKVEVGSVLWQLVNRAKEVLDEIKADVRAAALAEREGEVGASVIDGNDLGSATVNIQKPRLEVPKSHDMAPIKKVLGDRFSLFFDENTTYKPTKEFESRVEAVSDELEQNILLESVTTKDPTPRVSFRRDRLPKGDRS